MKRETVQWLRGVVALSIDSRAKVARDALATDAEVRRLRKLIRRLNTEGWTERVCEGVRLALKPAKGKVTR